MNTNLIHKWLKDPRFAPDRGEEALEPASFLPVDLESVSSSPTLPPAPAFSGALCAQRVDITLSDGRRILVEGSTALSAVLALVEGLMT